MHNQCVYFRHGNSYFRQNMAIFLKKKLRKLIYIVFLDILTKFFLSEYLLFPFSHNSHFTWYSCYPNPSPNIWHTGTVPLWYWEQLPLWYWEPVSLLLVPLLTLTLVGEAEFEKSTIKTWKNQQSNHILW